MRSYLLYGKKQPGKRLDCEETGIDNGDRGSQQLFLNVHIAFILFSFALVIHGNHIREIKLSFFTDNVVHDANFFVTFTR